MHFYLFEALWGYMILTSDFCRKKSRSSVFFSIIVEQKCPECGKNVRFQIYQPIRVILYASTCAYLVEDCCRMKKKTSNALKYLPQRKNNNVRWRKTLRISCSECRLYVQTLNDFVLSPPQNRGQLIKVVAPQNLFKGRSSTKKSRPSGNLRPSANPGYGGTLSSWLRNLLC